MFSFVVFIVILIMFCHKLQQHTCTRSLAIWMFLKETGVPQHDYTWRETHCM